MKNSNDAIGNRTRDLPACSAVPQPTALTRSPDSVCISTKLFGNFAHIFLVCQKISQPDRVVGIATGLRAGWFGVLNPSRLKNVQNVSGTHFAS